MLLPVQSMDTKVNAARESVSKHRSASWKPGSLAPGEGSEVTLRRNIWGAKVLSMGATPGSLRKYSL